MDQALDSVAIVIQHKNNRLDPQLEQIRERLHRQMQTAFASDQDAALVLSSLSDRLEGSDGGTSGVADTAKDSLVVHAGAFGQLRGPETEGRSACFTNDEVAFFEELA